jgi:hypothetical protein
MLAFGRRHCPKDSPVHRRRIVEDDNDDDDDDTLIIEEVNGSIFNVEDNNCLPFQPQFAGCHDSAIDNDFFISSLTSSISRRTPIVYSHTSTHNPGLRDVANHHHRLPLPPDAPQSI